MQTIILILFGGGAALVLLAIIYDFIVMARISAARDPEDRLDAAPSWPRLAIAWLVFHAAAIWCGPRHLLGLLRKRLFWRVDCSWCGRRVRNPVVWRPAPKISHTICPECFQKNIWPNHSGGDVCTGAAGHRPATSSPHPRRHMSARPAAPPVVPARI